MEPFLGKTLVLGRRFLGGVGGGLRSGRKELHGGRIQAIPLAGGRRSVGEHVAQVTIAAFAANLGSNHSVT